MELFTKIFVAAILVESVWETIKLIIDAATTDKKLFITKIGSLILGLLIAFDYSLDLPGIAGLINHWKYLGVILTGIIISRGSQFVHDLVKIIENNNVIAKNNKTLINNNNNLTKINEELLRTNEELKKSVYTPVNKS